MEAQLDDRTLRRIIGLLVALAAFAERAAGRSFPVRWFVLAVLRRAESVARDFVAEATQAAWPAFGEPLDVRGCREDAALLALRFRLLAAALRTLLPPEPQQGVETHAVKAALRHLAQNPFAVMPGDWSPRPHDTS